MAEELDPRTQAYLRELNKTMEQYKKVVDAAEKICTYGNCIEASMDCFCMWNKQADASDIRFSYTT